MKGNTVAQSGYDAGWLSRALSVLFMVLFIATQARATLIDFDELVFTEPDPDVFSDPVLETKNWVTDQYRELGVLFEGAYLVPQSLSDIDFVSTPNAISDLRGPSIWLSFIGAILPGSVSFYLSANLEDRIFVTAFDGSGDILDQTMTEGWGGAPELSTPYADNQLISLSGNGIARVEIAALYSRRGDIVLDNLAFNAPVPVSSPSTPALFFIGLMSLAPLVFRQTGCCHSKTQ